jgi:hypothetical protein
LPGEIRRLNVVRSSMCSPSRASRLRGNRWWVGRRRSYSRIRGAEDETYIIAAACHFESPSLLLLMTPPAPNRLHLTTSIHYSFLSYKVSLPKHGLAHHAFRSPRPRGCSRCSCWKRRPKDQSLSFGHLSTSDYLPYLLCSRCRCK